MEEARELKWQRDGGLGGKGGASQPTHPPPFVPLLLLTNLPQREIPKEALTRKYFNL